MSELPENNALFTSVKEVVINARNTAYRYNNATSLKMYWDIGQLIVEDEQQVKTKAIYGKGVLKNLANQLTLYLGNGFDERNLNNMRPLFNAFQIWNAVRTELKCVFQNGFNFFKFL